MTEIVDLYQESKNVTFYVPEFEVRVDGETLSDHVVRDVLDLTYTDSVKGIDSFQLTVNNWDDRSNQFKYVGSETKESLGKNPLHTLFDPCNNEVTVSLGYVGQLRVMLTGNFVTFETNFTGKGRPQLTVRGLNLLHQLRRKQNTRTWRDVRISQAVKSMERDFPLPIAVDRNAQRDEPILPFLAQRNQYDIDFIFAQARERGYVVFLREAQQERGPTRRELYFGPSQGKDAIPLRDVTFRLEWDKSLIDFTPSLTTANQVRSVTVNGWSRSRGQSVSATVDLDDPRLNRNRDLYEFLDRCAAREEIVVDEPVFTQQQARARAVALLQERQKDMVTAEGTTLGLPDLRSGKRLLIDGVGARFSGAYFVTETTHTWNESGYITKFKARREDDGSVQGGGAT
jgi:uncharacterized protein